MPRCVIACPAGMRDDPAMVSKCQPLADYLIARKDAGQMVLACGEIEEIIGVPLPKTMQVDTSAWNSTHHVYVRAWQSAGWVATLDWRNRQAVFIHNAEGEMR